MITIYIETRDTDVVKVYTRASGVRDFEQVGELSTCVYFRDLVEIEERVLQRILKEGSDERGVYH